MALGESLDGANLRFSATVVDEWIRCGVRHAVISPGSRSTPMALAISTRPEINTFVRLDERSAGFFALGMAKFKAEPVILLATSGTAVTELIPAAAEAYQSMVPLIICTADRPPELHGIGAPQTLRQVGPFDHFVKEVFEPGPPRYEASWSWRSLASLVYAQSLGLTPGPVQLNLAFAEPLIDGELEPISPRSDGGPWFSSKIHLGVADDQEILALFDPTKKGVFVVGANCGVDSSLYPLAEVLGWPVLADPRSGLIADHPNCVRYADSFLRSAEVAAQLVPERIIRLGESWSSKVLTNFITNCARNRGAVVVTLSNRETILDETRTNRIGHLLDVSGTIKRAVDVVRRTKNPDGNLTVPHRWQKSWAAADDIASSTIDELLACKPNGQGTSRTKLTEPGLSRSLMERLSSGDVVLVASSMPIRDLEWFTPKKDALPQVLANRGVNGIDGLVSTFLGIASVNQDPDSLTVGLLGDLALLHDFGSLTWRTKTLPKGLLVISDNDGGAIFSFLAQKSDLEVASFETLFGTPHEADIEGLLKGIGIPTFRIESSEDLTEAIKMARGSGGIKAAVFRSDRESNLAFHQRLQDTVIAALERPRDL